MEKPYNDENLAEDRNTMQQDAQQEFNPGAIDEVTERSRSKMMGCGPRPKRRRRRKSKCICKRRKRRRLMLSSNPFLIFYLELWFKSSGKRVTTVAREAGRKWCSMSSSKKRKYIRLAERVKRRRSRR